MDLLIEHELGVKPRTLTLHEIDEEFFAMEDEEAESTLPELNDAE